MGFPEWVWRAGNLSLVLSEWYQGAKKGPDNRRNPFCVCVFSSTPLLGSNIGDDHRPAGFVPL